MNTTPEMRATDHTHDTPPPPPPPPSPEVRPTAANGDGHHFHSTSKLNLEPENENKKEKEKDEDSPSCSSSYSSSDSESDFFQINPPELAYPPPTPTTTTGDLNTDGIEKISNPEREKSSTIGIERRSPVVQTMVRDPNRIPSSIFTRSPVTPMEWSVASNESLFSIHMGNTSFSKDQLFLTGRSGELRGYTSGMIEYPSPWISPDLRSGGVEKRELGDLVVEMDEAAAATANAEAMREVMRAAAEGKDSDKKVMLGRSISKHSDGSTTSFAFPILTGDGRIGSIKVNFEHHNKDHQPNQQNKPSKIVADEAPTAATRSHLPARSQATASIHRRWLSRFSGCKFCCFRCDY